MTKESGIFDEIFQQITENGFVYICSDGVLRSDGSVNVYKAIWTEETCEGDADVDYRLLDNVRLFRSDKSGEMEYLTICGVYIGEDTRFATEDEVTGFLAMELMTDLR